MRMSRCQKEQGGWEGEREKRRGFSLWFCSFLSPSPSPSPYLCLPCRLLTKSGAMEASMYNRSKLCFSLHGAYACQPSWHVHRNDTSRSTFHFLALTLILVLFDQVSHMQTKREENKVHMTYDSSC